MNVNIRSKKMYVEDNDAIVDAIVFVVGFYDLFIVYHAFHTFIGS